MTDFTGELDALPSDVQAIADLGRRDAERKPEPYELTAASSILVVRERNDEQTMLHDLEKWLGKPRTPRGHAELYDPTDFVDYVNRLTDPEHTTVWADVNAGTVTAVLDDHHDAVVAGWREHTVRLSLRDDADWLHWAKYDGKALQQHVFAQHLEDATHTIVRPDAATMLEVATSLQASRSAHFSQAIRLDNGDVQLTHHEDTTAKAGKSGNIEVPREFTLMITPWIGCKPIEVIAKLRYSIDHGQLAVGYSLVRPDLVKIEVFESIVATMKDTLDIAEVFNGTAPKALR
jgi:uncharacterized protein YfdQ (DUF2303 family)